MIRVRFVAAAAFVLVACESPTASPSLQRHTGTASTRDNVVKQNFFYDIDEVFFSPCNQEDTHLTGRSHVMLTTSTEGSKTTIVYHENMSAVRAVGLVSGREYIYNLVGKSVDTFDSEPPFAFSFESHGTQTTVVKGEGQFTRIHSIVSGTFDGTTFTIDEKKNVFECPGVTG